MAGATALAGCGGDSQDANEKAGTYRVEVVRTSFPRRQALADSPQLAITVRNVGDQAVPNIAVTVGNDEGDTFSSPSSQPGNADPLRPVWVINSGPVGGTSAYVDTWTLGRLAPQRTKTFRWELTSIKPGNHKLVYRVGGGLDGKARAELPGGGPVEGAISVNVSPKPAQACLTDTDEVIREQADETGSCQ